LSPSEIQTVFHQILRCLTSKGELLLLLPLDQATLCNARSIALKNYFPNHSIPFGIKDSTIYDSLFDLNKTPFVNSIVKLKTVQSFPFPNSLFKTYIEGWISELRDLPFDEKRKERYLNDIIEAMPKTTNGMVEFATKAYCLHIQKN
jgi:hypothetical protein